MQARIWGRRGSFPTRAACIPRCTAGGSGRCGSTPGSAPRKRRTRDSAICSTRDRPDSRWRSISPPRWGIDSDHPEAEGEVGRVGVAIDTVDDMDALFHDIPLDQVSTSMTINATAAILLAMYVVVGEEQGIRADGSGDDPERHPQGVHRARHLHLSARAVAASGRRRVPLRGRGRDEVQSDLDLRLSHARGGRDGGAGAGVHLRRRTRVRARARSPPGSRSTLRAAAVVLLRRAQRSVRGGRQVPRGAAPVGTAHARALRRERRRRRGCASTPRPAA